MEIRTNMYPRAYVLKKKECSFPRMQAADCSISQTWKLSIIPHTSQGINHLNQSSGRIELLSTEENRVEEIK